MGGLLDFITGQGKKKKAAQKAFYDQVEHMFPNESFSNTAMNMQHKLGEGHLSPDQYRWNKDVLPWRMSPQHWTDMMSTQEGLNPADVNQLHSDYWKMNYLPDVLNTQKNIDFLIEASETDKYLKKY